MPPNQILLLIIGVAAISWSGPLVRLATEAPPLAMAFWRTALATAVLAPIALARHRNELKGLTRSDLVALVSSAALLAVHFATWIASIDMTTVASSVLLVNSQPVFVALGSGLLGERVSSRTWAGIAIAIAGASLVAGVDFGASTRAGLGATLAIVGAAAEAGYWMIGRHLRRRMSLLTYVVMVYGCCALILLAGAVGSGAQIAGYEASTWLALGAIVAGPQLLGHTTFNFLLGKLEAAKVVVAILGEPVGAALLAAVLFGEIPQATILPGALLLIAGIGVVLFARQRPDFVPWRPDTPDTP